MEKIHCNLHYHESPLGEVESFALGVKAGYYGNNPPFTVLPLTAAALQLLIDDYGTTRAAYVNGGLLQKGPFLLAKTALMNALDSLTEEVDKVAAGNSEIIVLSGFRPTLPRGEGEAPARPTGVVVKRGATGELLAECPVVEGAQSYGCIVIAGNPLPAGFGLNGSGQFVIVEMAPTPPPPVGTIDAVFDFTKGRKKRFTGLAPHTVYYIYFYAVNATGVSPLSDVASLECL